MSLAQHLWDINADLAARIRTHDFVQGLGNGSLPIENFKRYVAQDAYFLDAFARGYAFCLANGTSREDLYGFAELISGVRRGAQAAQELHRAPADRPFRRDADRRDQVLCRLSPEHGPARPARRDHRGHDALHAALRLARPVARQDRRRADLCRLGKDLFRSRLRGAGGATGDAARRARHRHARRPRQLSPGDGTRIRLLRRQSLRGRASFLHRAFDGAVQVGGELGAHGVAHLLLGRGPQRQRALEQGAAGRGRHQLVASLVARLGALDQPVLQQRSAGCASASCGRWPAGRTAGRSTPGLGP